ncbi:oligopeptide:H+ symporter [Pseudoxanthomonas daejeonensis]|uniref:MFS transporter n=1 Tax=Pseudoxanthomonas daejeonensis TaxID=266062 RepID=A0ABQ6ZAU9_9GAMM|nr:oligopeptide:H+ symporter [Pseudoxanthomonas daejeonensis]KAF1697005.1 MFS transporter [Pseudoxanthomonas daejeonensis]UNK56384.1 oligopeptide:H+ symporter [Pseudoxanthomonas daejeonensis]
MSADVVEPKVAAPPPQPPVPPDFSQILGHPKPLWMLFMTEFWERFAFYGMRWALALYIVAQFYGGDSTGEAPASKLYGAYLALVYAAALFGGYVADRIIGYQRSILLGAAIMAAGLFMIMLPNEQVFKLGLATVIVGNGLFKPNISTMVGKLYSTGDERRDSGFTLFYMGINLGAMIAPWLTGLLAERVMGGTSEMPTYKVVFLVSGIGMLISLVWFWFGRRQLKGIGEPIAGAESGFRVLVTAICALASIPLIYFLLSIGAGALQWILTALFVALCVLILREGFRDGPVRRDMAIAMLIIFVFNVLFWCFFEQAGSSFNFLAQNIVNRDFSGWIFPVGWFQSVNSLAIITLAPVLAWLWVRLSKVEPNLGAMRLVRVLVGVVATVFSVLAMYRLSGLGVMPGWAFFVIAALIVVLGLWATRIDLGNTAGSLNPSIPRKFGFGIIFNGVAFLLLMVALSSMVDPQTLKIPFWTLFMVYVIQSVGELCLSPIGLSMVTKLAPVRLVGFGMGGWFLSTAIGNNLSGIFASHVSGETGMTVESAFAGYTIGFWILMGSGLLLFLIAPLIQKLMHGVK